MKTLTRKLAAVAALILVADQLTKTAARIWLPACEIPGSPGCSPTGTGPLRFLRMGNGGSALGFAQGEGLWTLLALGGLVLTFAYLARRPTPLLVLAAGLQLGGAASNVGDRLVAGAVTDFVVAGPVVLNIADLALLAGTAIAVAVLAADPTRPHDHAGRR